MTALKQANARNAMSDESDGQCRSLLTVSLQNFHNCLELARYMFLYPAIKYPSSGTGVAAQQIFDLS
jgi:hypothetical protein